MKSPYQWTLRGSDNAYIAELDIDYSAGLLKGLKLPKQVIGGKDVKGWVLTDKPALRTNPGGVRASAPVVIKLSSDNAAASVPDSVTEPPGKKKAQFKISTKKVSQATMVTITATLNGRSKSGKLTVKPAKR